MRRLHRPFDLLELAAAIAPIFNGTAEQFGIYVAIALDEMMSHAGLEGRHVTGDDLRSGSMISSHVISLPLSPLRQHPKTLHESFPVRVHIRRRSMCNRLFARHFVEGRRTQDISHSALLIPHGRTKRGGTRLASR